jgi:energy-converting hydrogenase B subunit Q
VSTLHAVVVTASDRPGMLSAVTKVLADHNANIRYVDLHSVGDRAEIYFEFSLEQPSDQVFSDLTRLDGVTSLEEIPSFAKIYGKRIIIMGGGAQVGQVALGAITEADRHNIRGERISIDTIPLVGEDALASAVRAVVRLPRVRLLVLAGSIMGGDISRAVEEVRAKGLVVISLNMAGSVPDVADLVVSDPVQAGVMAVMAIADERFELEHGRARGMASSGGPATEGSFGRQALRWPDPGVATRLFDPESVLRLRGVNKTYGQGDETVHALRDVSLEAHAGEVVGLVGRSGSGKTTLLNVAAGWESPDEGHVESPGDGGWSQIAVLPQHLGLMDELSVQENVEYPARMAGALDERRDLIDDLIEALGLDPAPAPALATKKLVKSGVCMSRLRALFAVCPDARKWPLQMRLCGRIPDETMFMTVRMGLIWR